VLGRVNTKAQGFKNEAEDHEADKANVQIFKKVSFAVSRHQKTHRRWFLCCECVWGTFEAAYFSGVEGTNYPVHDYQFILDNLKKRRRKSPPESD
jgi:hypothetical protein